MLLHLSDLHFGTERPECIRAIQKFCAVHKPEVVVVSGDLTQRAKFKEFYACKQFLESQTSLILWCPATMIFLCIMSGIVPLDHLAYINCSLAV